MGAVGLCVDDQPAYDVVERLAFGAQPFKAGVVFRCHSHRFRCVYFVHRVYSGGLSYLKLAHRKRTHDKMRVSKVSKVSKVLLLFLWGI